MTQIHTPPLDGIDTDPESCDYRVTFDPETDSPSQVLVRTVARIEGRDPLDLPSLYEVVDPEALDTVVCGAQTHYSRSDTVVSVRYCGYDVSVRAEGSIDIR